MVAKWGKGEMTDIDYVGVPFTFQVMNEFTGAKNESPFCRRYHKMLDALAARMPVDYMESAYPKTASAIERRIRSQEIAEGVDVDFVWPYGATGDSREYVRFCGGSNGYLLRDAEGSFDNIERAYEDIYE